MALGLSLLAMWFRQAILEQKAMVQLVQKHKPFEGRVEERLCHFRWQRVQLVLRMSKLTP